MVITSTPWPVEQSLRLFRIGRRKPKLAAWQQLFFSEIDELSGS
jgi:hypothetical protein